MVARIVLVLTVLSIAAASAVGGGQVATIAGTGVEGFAGDGGPALSAQLNTPYGVAVAPDGVVYFADLANLRIRRINLDGRIETVAGTGEYGYDGDGGPATSAFLSDVMAIALDPARNVLYLADTSNGVVRRIDLTTGTIHAVTNLSFAFPQGIAVDAAGTIYVAETLFCQIIRIDPDTEAAQVFAGTANQCSHAGDGGPASNAFFSLPTRLAVDAAGNLFVIDTELGANSTSADDIRRIDATTGIVTTVAGGGSNVPGTGAATSMNLGLVKSIATDTGTGGATRLFIAQECQIFVVDLASGQMSRFAGSAVCSGLQDAPPAAAIFNVIGGVTYGPDDVLFVADSLNHRLRTITPILDDYLRDGTADTEIIVPGVTRVRDFTIVNNDSLMTIDSGALQDAASVYIANNGALRDTSLRQLQNVGGDFTYANNGNDGTSNTLYVGELATVDGSVAITGNDGSSNTYYFNELQTVGGSFIADGNSNTILLPELDTIGEDFIADGSSNTIYFPELDTVGGDMDVRSTGRGRFDATACAGGSMTIEATGYDTVLATTGQTGTTSVTSMNDGSTNTIVLPENTFNACVNFSLSRIEAPDGTATDGSSNTLMLAETIDAYEIAFEISTLGRPATITFEIVLANLTPDRQAEVLDALNTGLLRLVTTSSTPGFEYEAFDICTAGQEPVIGGCVGLVTLDAEGNPTSEAPAVIRLTGVTGHFSTWAVAIVTPISQSLSFNGLLQPYPTRHTTTPVFKRGSVVPLKFNWIDASGAVADSAAANPTLSIHGGSCADQPPTTSPLQAEDAGQSNGWRYDAATRTWTFGWSTKPLAAGCYWIQVTSGASEFPGPSVMFPIALRSK